MVVLEVGPYAAKDDDHYTLRSVETRTRAVWHNDEAASGDVHDVGSTRLSKVCAALLFERDPPKPYNQYTTYSLSNMRFNRTLTLTDLVHRSTPAYSATSSHNHDLVHCPTRSKAGKSG